MFFRTCNSVAFEGVAYTVDGSSFLFLDLFGRHNVVQSNFKLSHLKLKLFYWKLPEESTLVFAF